MTVSLDNPAKAKSMPANKAFKRLLLFIDSKTEAVIRKKETICAKFQEVPTKLTQKCTVPNAKNIESKIEFFKSVIFLNRK